MTASSVSMDRRFGFAASLFIGIAMIGLTGCATVTSPEKRIAADLELFHSLPEKHQDLISRGQVTEGMSKDAVYLSWGRPHETKQSSRDGKARETWVYYGSEAVPVQTVGVSMGYGGYYGPGCASPFYDFGYQYANRDYVAGKVEFEKNQVVFWERNERR
jgi:outer membrane protein assembly factor BamE (lipoprotein component of BamABCDE complex)